MPPFHHFECSRCNQDVPADTPQTVCPQCAGSLYVRYDLRPLAGTVGRDAIAKAAAAVPWAGMWRYRSVLPEVQPVTLGEGWTPMLPSRRHPNVFLKEEGANPTGTFKARGLALAVTMAKHYGFRKLAVPSAGNAAGRWPPMQPRQALKRIFLCPATCLLRTTWKRLLTEQT